jgi:hypothetical protein
MAQQMMSGQADGIQGDSRSKSWGPATLFAAAIGLVRRTALEPGMPRMSSEWLLSHDKFGSARFKGY